MSAPDPMPVRIVVPVFADSAEGREAVVEIDGHDIVKYVGSVRIDASNRATTVHLELSDVGIDFSGDAQVVAHLVQSSLPVDEETIRSWINGIDRGLWDPSDATKHALADLLRSLVA